MGADGSLKFDTEIDESGFNAGIQKLGSIVKGGAALFGLKELAEGVVNLGKAALSSVADIEQNIGGIETLFGDSASAVIANAEAAYQTAGMSANNYMETVTSFSASLLQSLGDDTTKAVDYADMAIIDMSDNANKMGTSMELIQNAYQGFAKQNYTMLDNLNTMGALVA
jgi:phage-related protein